MFRKTFILFISLLSSLTLLKGQSPVTVAETTLRVNILGEEFFYFGFAEGDQIIFTFEEASGKEMKEVEIIEMPSTSRFLEVKTKKIDNKIIRVSKTGIYKFRFVNSSISARACKYKIQRIPASEATQNFNCTVYYRTGFDTTYTTVMEDFISYADTVINNLQDRNTKILPAAGTGSNKASFNFILPEHTIAWSYYLCVDKQGKDVFDEAAKKFTASASYLVSKYNRQGPLAGLAFGIESHLEKTSSGLPVNYWIVDGENEGLFMNGAQFRYMKKAKANNDFSRMDARKGALHFCFSNDHPTETLVVTVKITTVQVTPFLDTRPVKQMHTSPKKEMYLKN